jgi:hypothetical protein
LKNSFVPFSDPVLGAESLVFGRFEPGAGPAIGLWAAFSTGWSVLRRGVFSEVLDTEEEDRGNERERTGGSSTYESVDTFVRTSVRA